MATLARDLLLQLHALSTPEERTAFVFQNPALLGVDGEQALEVFGGSSTAEEREALVALVEQLEGWRARLAEDPGSYPIGLGPVETLWQQATNGMISEDRAVELARASAGLLSPVYVFALSEHLVRAAMDDDWARAVAQHRLLRGAVAALPPSPQAAELRRITDSAWVEIATRLLVDVPDGRVYRDALAAGERTAAEWAAAGDRRLGLLLHRLGALHLDPYTARHDSRNYELSLHRWQQRLPQVLGSGLAGVPEEEWRMPGAETALKTAAGYLARAAAARQGHARGLSLKALVQALEWRGLTGTEVDRDEILARCADALECWEPERSPHQWLSVLATMNRHGAAIDVEAVRRVFTGSFDDHVRRMGAAATVHLVEAAILIYRTQDPAEGLRLLQRARPLLRRHADEQARLTLWAEEVKLIAAAFSPEVGGDLRSPGRGELSGFAQELIDRGAREEWDVQAIGAALIQLAADSPRFDEETTGLALLDVAAIHAPLLADAHEEALASLRSDLMLNEAVNRFGAGDLATAIQAYGQALRGFMNLKLRSRAMDCLQRIADLAIREGEQVIWRAISNLAPLALRIDNELGEPATELLRRLCRNMTAALARRSFGPDEAFFLWQIAKGLRLAGALQVASRYDWRADEEGVALLRQIEQLEATLPPDAWMDTLPEAGSHLDENFLVTAYVRPSAPHGGGSPEERLVNLQHRYDAHVNSRLLGSASADDPLFLTTAEVQATLGERTVILYFYEGATADGNAALFSLLLTDREVKVGAVASGFPSGTIVMSDGGRRVELSPTAINVQSVRAEILVDPADGEAVAGEAADSLRRMVESLLGRLAEPLEELRLAGKDHLCIVPHGALHYLPFHLLGELGSPFAERWIVTYLPNLHLLVSGRGRPALERYRRHTLRAIGLGFADRPRGLAPIQEAVDECRDLAAIFGTEPLLEEQATEEAVMKALQNSRYVHLATHGKLHAEAPAFQCLYLAPGESSDGVLYAYELLPLDLRGLELLTLGACETALGRFDTSDNLRGLPATLFLAGVSTIVGTLWDAETHAAATFFGELYRQLKGGTPRLDSFAAAQRETRRLHPEYRDWGAFYFMGDWN
jgi:CHAT domain-containing protein